MSSVLAVVLMAATAVPGSGPEGVSAETEQQLDLRGEWKGIWVYDDGTIFQAVAYSGGRLIGIGPEKRDGGDLTFLELSDVIDEGGGNLRGKWWWSEDGEWPSWYQGIYRQESGRLTICFRNRPHPRPNSFRAGNGQHLLILRRVQPRR